MWAITAACIVGTAENHVGESPDSMSADSAATKAAGSNALMHVTCAPAATEARSDAARAMASEEFPAGCAARAGAHTQRNFSTRMWLLAASRGACVDSHPQCSDFAALGECESNAASMRTLCARSCDFCRDPAAPACHDRRQECPVWTRLGLCARVPQAMLEAVSYTHLTLPTICSV